MNPMFTPYFKLYELLSSSERKGMWGLVALTLSMAILDTIGIASVMPFISVLSNPEILSTNRILASTYAYLGFGSQQQFLIFLGIGTFVTLMASVLFRSLTLWAQLRFTNMGIHNTACRVVETYLHQPYSWFLDRHSADLGTRVLSEVTNVFQGAFYPAMLIIANSLVTLFLVVFLFLVDPQLAFASFLILGGMYGAIFLFVRRMLVRIGEERISANHERYRILNEAFGAIKDVKASGLEQTFLGLFFSPSQRMANSSVRGAVIAEMPSFVLQGLVFGGMILLLLYLIATYGSLQNAMPVVAIYALAGYRLLPALQGIYRNLSQMRFNLPSLDTLHSDLIGLRTSTESWKERVGMDRRSRPLGLRTICQLRGITFKYDQASLPALEGLDLDIKANSMVGIVGGSGAGKTTLVDILLGLLLPNVGEVVVDGQTITGDNRLAWQRTIGYVSQNIVLSEGSIASNIAFGVSERDIDSDAIARAASSAQLDEFVDELPYGIDTGVGEKGVRLSGGQRQRIGIARALYHDPAVLILDEATSALDSITEQKVMQSVRSLGKQKTIVLIAHRLSSVRGCDVIHMLKNGNVSASGTFEELLSRNSDFRKMVESSEIDVDSEQS
ncbi:MAG: ABC transporter ATP-binding protein [Pseudomonadales bacterium]